MDFGCAGAADHAHDLAAGGAAHDGIVQQDHALAFEQGAHRVQFQLDSEIAHGLARLDKSASDIVVADQPEAQRKSALRGISNRGGNAGVGHGNDNVGFRRGFARQLSSETFPAFLHGPTEHHAIGTREIHVLEDAARLGRRWGIETGGNARRADDDQFPRFYITLEGGAD